jgi:hypothetical protein
MVLGRWAALSYSLYKVALSPFFRGQIWLCYIQATQSSDSGTRNPCPISLSLHHHISRGLSNTLQYTVAASSSRRYGAYTTYRCQCCCWGDRVAGREEATATSPGHESAHLRSLNLHH